MFTAICIVASLQETYEQKRSEHLKDMHAREERMRQMFVQKVCIYVLSEMWMTIDVNIIIEVLILIVCIDFSESTKLNTQ